jgi:lysophospholipase L1-like esterase
MRFFSPKIADRLLVAFFPLYGSYWVFIVLSTFASYYFWGFWGIGILPGAFFVGELLLRVLLRLSYGPQYRYVLFTYFLQNDDRYGTGLKKGARSREVPFLLFDTFVFPFGTGRIFDLEKNKAQRNIYSVNSLGFRGKEFDPQKKSAKMRIFCVGGSTTACDSNDDEETWPAQLERLLQNGGYDVEVINAGVPGWYSYKDYIRFREEIITYQPDLVLIHEGWNEEFNYSSLALGKHWKPALLRRIPEERMLYSLPNRFLSSTRFLSKFVAIQTFRKKFVFNRTMSFQNPGRWQILRRREYIVDWVENLIMMAQIAKQKDFLLYSIDYPSLVSLEDTADDRATYIAHSRLTPLFAQYQAVAKERISKTLSLCAHIIPNLSVKNIPYTGMERVACFGDEMHLTPRGNRWLAEAVAEQLLKNPFFEERYKRGRGSNVSLDPVALAHVRAEAGRNSYTLERVIATTIDNLSNQKNEDHTELPTDRYTTF